MRGPRVPPMPGVAAAIAKGGLPPLALSLRPLVGRTKAFPACPEVCREARATGARHGARHRCSGRRHRPIVRPRPRAGASPVPGSCHTGGYPPCARGAPAHRPRERRPRGTRSLVEAGCAQGVPAGRSAEEADTRRCPAWRGRRRGTGLGRRDPRSAWPSTSSWRPAVSQRHGTAKPTLEVFASTHPRPRERGAVIVPAWWARSVSSSSSGRRGKARANVRKHGHARGSDDRLP
jgi:hypothetical protein